MSNDLMQIERLNRLAQQIGLETAKVDFTNPEKGKNGYREVVAKIEGWHAQVVLVEKQLKSRTHFNNMIHDQNRFGAGAFAAKQRHGSHAANIDKVNDAVKKVLAELARLIASLDSNTDNAETRALKGVSHALGNWLKSAKSTETAMFTDAPQALQATIVQARPHMPAGSAGVPGMGALDGFTLILALIVLIKADLKKRFNS